MSRMIDETGNRYGRLTVVERAPDRGKKRPRVAWLCRCDCGNEAEVLGENLRGGRSTSCGCYLRDWIVDTKTTHGHAKRGRWHPLYRTWAAMLERCTNPHNKSYQNYGGRGVKVCGRWSGEDGFANFLEDMGERPADPDDWEGSQSYWSLDRIDVNGDYTPDNCRWADPTTQASNTRRAVMA